MRERLYMLDDLRKLQPYLQWANEKYQSYRKIYKEKSLCKNNYSETMSTPKKAKIAKNLSFDHTDQNHIKPNSHPSQETF